MAAVTAEPLALITESEDHEDFFEIIDDQRVELPPMGAHEVWLASQIFSRIDHWARPQGLGQAVMEMLFDLRPALNPEPAAGSGVRLLRKMGQRPAHPAEKRLGCHP